LLGDGSSRFQAEAKAAIFFRYQDGKPALLCHTPPDTSIEIWGPSAHTANSVAVKRHRPGDGLTQQSERFVSLVHGV
jgi:hypothetical protein